ncbi:unnamed protein product [Ophioblennius macclurei]
MFSAAVLCVALLQVIPGSDGSTISAIEGGNVTLPCKGLSQTEVIIKVEWTRLLVEKNKDVLFYRNGVFDVRPPYENRADLLDRSMRESDVSLILKNLTLGDGGLYRCSVNQRADTPDSTSVTDFSTNIVLEVVPPGFNSAAEDGRGRSVSLIVGLAVAALAGLSSSC